MIIMREIQKVCFGSKLQGTFPAISTGAAGGTFSGREQAPDGVAGHPAILGGPPLLDTAFVGP